MRSAWAGVKVRYWILSVILDNMHYDSFLFNIRAIFTIIESVVAKTFTFEISCTLYGIRFEIGLGLSNVKCRCTEKVPKQKKKLAKCRVICEAGFLFRAI